MPGCHSAQYSTQWYSGQQPKGLLREKKFSAQKKFGARGVFGKGFLVDKKTVAQKIIGKYLQFPGGDLDTPLLR